MVKELSDRLKKTDESYMVRHECAEALGAIATPECEQLLREFAKDNEVSSSDLGQSPLESGPGELRSGAGHGRVREHRSLPVREGLKKPDVIVELVIKCFARYVSSMFTHSVSDAVNTWNRVAGRRRQILQVMKSVGLLRRSLSTASARHFQACASANPAEQGAEDVGKLYSVSAEAVKALRFADTLPKPFAAQVDTLAECAWLCRGTLLETVGCLKAVRPDFPALRLVLYGQMGTGKSVTLHQAVHFAFENQWVVWHVPRGESTAEGVTFSRPVLTWLRVIRDVQANQRKKNRVDTPEHAVNFLALFKSQNARMWPKLGVSCSCVWV